MTPEDEDFNDFIAETKAKDKAKFFENLVNSIPAQFHVARWLYALRRGKIDIFIPALGTDLDKFTDGGDLIINGRDVVEVKHRYKIPFTCADDWPFADMIVSNVEPTDRKADTFMWVIVNKDMTYGARIMATSKPHWRKRYMWCGNFKRHEWKYVVGLEHVKFFRF